jgi:drug/metabolite transporter (DMT)-like permease
MRPPFLTGEALHWAMLLPLVTAAANSVYQLLTRKPGGRGRSHAPPSSIPAIAAMLVTGLVQPFVWHPGDAWRTWPLFADALGLLGGAGHCLMVLAFARAPASLLAPMSYTQILWAGLAGVLVFGDWPDGWTLAGPRIIAAGGILVAIPGASTPAIQSDAARLQPRDGAAAPTAAIRVAGTKDHEPLALNPR